MRSSRSSSVREEATPTIPQLMVKMMYNIKQKVSLKMKEHLESMTTRHSELEDDIKQK
jgi:hypothetical protein